ncbi:MAG: nucleotide sugar dehydrogenase [Candidatus Odinarchaeota archaeon]
MKLIERIKQKKAVITIVGLGYVGLPTALIFAKKGFRVIGLETDEEKVNSINSGISPIKDDFLLKELPEQVKNGNFMASGDYHSAVSAADAMLLILPTPVNEAKEPDLVFVIEAATSVSKYLKKGQLIVLESTVYPGVTEEIIKPILEKSGLRSPEDFGLAYCPERFNPGDSDHTVEKVVRVVGGIAAEWTDAANALYSQVQETFVTVDIKTAEAAKVIENTQRDLNIALMNEIALICEHLKIDVYDVLEAASTKWNFGRYLPGPGVGGHCLPHDPYYLVKKAREHGYHAQVILAGRKVNDEMPLHVMQLLIKGLNYSKKPLNGSKIVIFGATYKKNIDDLRTSPTETLVNELHKRGAEIFIVEPNVDNESVFGCKKLDSVNLGTIGDTDAIVFMVEHNQFSEITPGFLKSCFNDNKGVIIIDGVRMLDQSQSKQLGFIYLGIGDGKTNDSY